MPLIPNLEQKLREGNTPPPVDQVSRSLGDLAASAAQAYDQTPEGQARQQAAGNLSLVVLDSDIRVAFETSHDRTVELFDTILPDLTVPTMAELLDAGVDFATLEHGYQGYEAAGMAPALVLAPIDLPLGELDPTPAPAIPSPTTPSTTPAHTPSTWRQAYANLRHWQETTYPQPPDDQPDPLAGRRLKHQDDGDGLWVWSGVATNWDDLNHQAVTNTPGTAITTTNPDGTTTTWKVLVVPTADKAHGGLVPNVTHDLATGRGNLAEQVIAGFDGSTSINSLTPADAHMPMGTYLPIHATHFAQDQLPQDDNTYTWTHSSFTVPGDTTLQAPAVFWGPGDGQVCVYYGLVGYSSDAVGVRLPVWG